MSNAALAFPLIDPVAIAIGPIVIRWYALAYVAGLVAGWIYARRLVANTSLWREQPGDPALIDDLLVWIAFGVIIGGRLVYVIFYNPAYFLAHPLEIVAIWQGGMAFHGGLIGAATAIALYARRYGVPVLSYFDVAAAAAPIGLFFGRVANFINGELWGRPTDLPWAVVFPHAGPEPRHPSQLYEAALEGILLFLVLAIAIRLGALKRPGLLAGLFGLGYGIARIAVEFYREPDAQLGYLVGPVTMGMVLSAPLVLAGLALILNARRGRAA
ncbi:MAG: prolipoprotein diacylglyceryl transferase [Labrys sp. (in: a-proteobacteria)]